MHARGLLRAPQGQLSPHLIWGQDSGTTGKSVLISKIIEELQGRIKIVNIQHVALSSGSIILPWDQIWHCIQVHFVIKFLLIQCRLCKSLVYPELSARTHYSLYPHLTGLFLMYILSPDLPLDPTIRSSIEILCPGWKSPLHLCHIWSMRYWTFLRRPRIEPGLSGAQRWGRTITPPAYILRLHFSKEPLMLRSRSHLILSFTW